MSLTTNILAELARNPGATAEEIADALSETAIRIRNNLAVMGAPTGGRMVSKELDEVTRKPGYKITAAGIAKLKSNGNGAKPEPQAGVGKNTASDGSGTLSSPEAVAVAAEHPGPDAGPPPANAEGPGGDVEQEPLAARMERYEAAIAEIHDICRDAGIKPGLVHERVRELARKVSERSQAEMSLLNIIGDIRSAIGDKAGRIMLGDLSATLRKRLAADSEAIINWQEIGAHCGFLQPKEVIALIDKLRTELAAERQAREAIQEQIDADPAVDVKDAARGYLIRAPKRRLRIVTKPETARDAAMAAARNGSGRGDVFALVPVGTARRGAEWRDA